MSCLFDSLGHLTGQEPTLLRREICNYISRNPDLIEGVSSNDVILWESGLSLESYVTEMRKASTWGGCVEIKAFVDMTGIPVHVVDVRSSPTRIIKLEPSGRPSQDYPLVLHWSGCHYSPSGASRRTRAAGAGRRAA